MAPLGTAYGMLNQAVGQYQGQYAHVGMAIKDMLEQRRELGKERRGVEAKKELLGEEARLKYSPQALEFERAKGRISGTGVKVVGKSLVDTQGNVLYEAPAGKTFKVVENRLLEIDARTNRVRPITDEMGNILLEFQQGGGAETPIPSVERKQFRNRKTGKLETFEWRNGKWQKVGQPQ